jgi:hypothetical protein
MKVEIELKDFENLYYCYEDEELTTKDIKKILIDVAIEKFIDKIYDDYMNDKAYESIKNDAREFIKNHSGEIVDKVVDKVSNEVVKKKAIVDEMPKRSELTNISKEWENYFIELIDKAIAKRFK